MVFWVIAAVLTLGASMAVLLPLAGSARQVVSVRSRDDRPHDLEVYRDQLSEIDRDLARGLILPAEAEQARAEIGRRILRLGDGGAERKAEAAAPGGMRLVSAVAVLAVPLISWGLYAQLGSPDLPSQPLAARLAKNPADSSVDELVARAEAHLAASPSDGRGWDVLAPIYLRMGRFSDSVAAYRNAIRLEGATAERQAGLGEAIASAAGGIISADAQAAFEASLKNDPQNPKAGFYLAVALMQEGRAEDAKTAWKTMLTTLPADSPWRMAVERALAEAGDKSATAPVAANGPSDEAMAAASSMSPQDRAAMIETMVADLDEKLRQNPHDEQGWTRLIRSYAVLGKADQARAALSRAIAAFGPDSAQAKTLTAFAASLGLAATE